MSWRRATFDYPPWSSRSTVVQAPGRKSYVLHPSLVWPSPEEGAALGTPQSRRRLIPECTSAAQQSCSLLIDTVVEAKGARKAEMAKLIENTIRHVNIALANEMVRFSNELEIDLWNAIDCASTKPFGYTAFRPGPRVGGHCIPVDPSYLSDRVRAKLGYSFRMVELAEEIDTASPPYVADRLAHWLNWRKQAVNGSRIPLVGVTYKANISDRRETPALPLAQRLLPMGADLRYHDPYVADWTVDVAGISMVVDRAADVYKEGGFSGRSRATAASR
jgi:UDP-N-acetyl-D-glucosamine dehydrogenase